MMLIKSHMNAASQGNKTFSMAEINVFRQLRKCDFKVSPSPPFSMFFFYRSVSLENTSSALDLPKSILLAPAKMSA